MGITDIEVLKDTEVTVKTDNPIHTHIIDRGDDKRSVHVLLMEARVNGTPLTALCGYTWVPSRDPLKFPLCDKCKEIFEFAKDFRGV